MNDEKWKIHHQVEDNKYRNFDDDAIRCSLGFNGILQIKQLLLKYGALIGGMNGIDMFTTRYGYGSAIIKCAIRAPSMTDDEAMFIKDCLDNHMYKKVIRYDSCKM